MGAIFRDKKKTKLPKWKVYYISYIWNKYSVNTSSDTKWVQVSSSISSNLGRFSVGNSFTDDSTHEVNYCYKSYNFSNTSGLNFINKNGLVLSYFLSGQESLSTYPYFAPYTDIDNRDDPYPNIKNYNLHSIIKATEISQYTSSGDTHYVLKGSIVDLAEKQTTYTYSKGSTSYGTVSSTSKYTYPTNGKSGNYWYVYSTSAKGSYIKTISAKKGTYPTNGISGNYWYVLIE